MSGRVMVDSHIRLPMASLTSQSPPGSSSCFGPISAPGEAGISGMDCTSNRFIKISTYASCDNFIVPSSTSLSMPHPSYYVHSPRSFVGNLLLSDASNDSQSSSDPLTKRSSTYTPTIMTTTPSTTFRKIHGSALLCSNPSAIRLSAHK